MPDPEITMPTFTVRESSQGKMENNDLVKNRDQKKKSLAGDNYAILIHRMTRLLSIVVSYRVVSRMVRISSSVEPSSIHPANAMRAVIKKDIEINETDEANKKKVSLNSSPMLPAKKETKKDPLSLSSFSCDAGRRLRCSERGNRITECLSP